MEDDLMKQLEKSNARVVVRSSGEVIWIPPAKFAADCSSEDNMMKMEDPTEPQRCHIKLGSWTYDGLHLNLTTYYGTEQVEAETSWFSRNSPYIVAEQEQGAIVVKKYDCCVEPYQSIHFRWIYNFDNDL